MFCYCSLLLRRESQFRNRGQDHKYRPEEGIVTVTFNSGLALSTPTQTNGPFSGSFLKVREETSGSIVVHAIISALGTVKQKDQLKASLGSYILGSCSLNRGRTNKGQRNGNGKKEERKKGEGTGRKG